MAARQDNARQMVTALVNSLSQYKPDVQTSNPLRHVPRQAKNILLTLYALFEKELLPALDLLDRNLVTRLNVPPAATGTALTERASHFFLVRSAQQLNHRNSRYDHVNEVRPLAWTCSCPAFTFSAFPSITKPDNDVLADREILAPHADKSQWLFGGLSRGSDIPVCKHLLACVLAENCALFEEFVEEKEANIEELAGWAAGYGD